MLVTADCISAGTKVQMAITVIGAAWNGYRKNDPRRCQKGTTSLPEPRYFIAWLHLGHNA